MKNLTLFSEITDELITYVVQTYSSNLDKVDDFNFLKDLINTDFPFGFKNIPKVICLYKVLYLDKVYDLDMLRLKPHYVSNVSDIENIKLKLDGAEYEGKPYVLTIQTYSKNIDVMETLINNMVYQFEYETTLFLESRVEFVEIKPYNFYVEQYFRKGN